MKTTLFSRMTWLALAAGAILLAAGCGTSQRPNWYDSYYYRDGRLVVPAVPDTAPAAGVWSE